MVSNLRIGGLASGLDIDQIVKDLMAAARKPVDKLKQDKTLLQWKKDDYRAINTLLRSLRDEASKMRLQSTFLPRKATSSDTAVVTVSSANNAATGTYTIEVTQLADASRVSSSGTITSAGFDPNKSILSQKNYFTDSSPLAGDPATLSFTIKTYKEDGTAVEKTFTVNTSDSLNGILSKISSDRDLGIAVFYDPDNNKVYMSTTRTGDNNASGKDIEITGDFLTKTLMLDTANVVDGKNALVKFNGFDMVKKSNEFTVNGTTFTLQGESQAGKPVSVSVTSDGDAIFNSVKSFIDKYNEIIAKIDAEVKEERYRDYLPLTEEQKKEMSDDEVKLWEEKARSGMLKGDPILRGVLDKMRYAWSNPVQGLDAKYDQMSEYGLSTGTYLEGGKLYITNEQKLKDAINNRPEEVLKFFTQKSDTNNDSEKGVAQRLYDAINKAMDDMTKQAGSDLSLSLYDNSVLAERIKDIDKRIEQKENRLMQLEDRYWRQFTAMEQAIQRANMQSAWLMQQFSQ
ncbi:flagellar hook-associated protein 2 [Zhaonella formicivorans]|uniref:flagellar hook-associated protein 2 n=1 Tax=Zhaonella formicivorans TaxID=2528593 RepID=UPI0010EE1B43|nr:flagellar hook-associated protein 2 [Zhaonella formicivorans]